MPSYFQNAKKVAFHGNIINTGTYTQIESTIISSPLELLVNSIAVGGMHNSEERSDVPKCHLETRVAVQEAIVSWITDGDADALPRRVMWMSGPAGTGKTAIAGSVAEICKARGLLAASFFFSSFSPSLERCSKRYWIATIAYQLLQHDEMQGVGRYILEAIARNPAVFQMRLEDQLEELILRPLQDHHAKDCSVKIFLDETYDPDADIDLYLRSKFSDIRRRYNIPSQWPTDDAIVSLVRNASGQFIYAATVVRYISESTDLPQSTLNCVLNLGPPPSNGSNPFAALDALYMRILNSSPNPRLAIKWLFIIQTFNAGNQPAVLWKQFLESAPGEGKHLLSSLTSLISIHPPHDQASPYRIYHKSLFDFFHRLAGMPRHPLYVSWSAEGGVGQFLQTRVIGVMKDQGLVREPTSDTHRQSFLDLFWKVLSVSTPLMHIKEGINFNNAPAICQPRSNPDMLLCDVDWWVTWVVSHPQHHAQQQSSFLDLPSFYLGFHPFHCCPWNLASEVIAGLFWDVHILCPWHHCLPVCKLWRGTILRICKEHGWRVPGKWKLLRNRFVKSTRYADHDADIASEIIFPNGGDFIPPPTVPIAEDSPTSHSEGDNGDPDPAIQLDEVGAASALLLLRPDGTISDARLGTPDQRARLSTLTHAPLPDFSADLLGFGPSREKKTLTIGNPFANGFKGLSRSR